MMGRKWCYHNDVTSSITSFLKRSLCRNKMKQMSSPFIFNNAYWISQADANADIQRAVKLCILADIHTYKYILYARVILKVEANISLTFQEFISQITLQFTVKTLHMSVKQNRLCYKSCSTASIVYRIQYCTIFKRLQVNIVHYAWLKIVCIRTLYMPVPLHVQ